MGERISPNSGRKAKWKDCFVCTGPTTSGGGSCVCSVYAKMNRAAKGWLCILEAGRRIQYGGPRCVKRESCIERWKAIKSAGLDKGLLDRLHTPICLIAIKSIKIAILRFSKRSSRSFSDFGGSSGCHASLR